MSVIGTTLVAASLIGAVTASSASARSVGIRQLAGTSGCVVVGPRDGCRVARGARGATEWQLSADQSNAYGLSLNGGSLITLRRMRGGGFRQLPGRAGCLTAARTPGCHHVALLRGFYEHLSAPSGGHGVYVLENDQGPVRVLSLVRDTGTGALRPARAGACVAASRVAGCQRIHGLTPVDTVVAAASARDLYLVGTDAIVHLRRGAHGGLTQPAADGACIARAITGCRTASGLPLSTDNAQAWLSGDERFLYVTYSGSESTSDGSTWTGAILEFARDPVTGSLTQLTQPDGCLSSILLGDEDCTDRWEFQPIIGALEPTTSTQAYAVTLNLVFEGGSSIVPLTRDPRTGRLTPADAPATCWGAAIDPSQVDAPPPPSSPRCSPVKEWRTSVPTGSPLITGDARNVYIWAQAAQNFADLPTLGGLSSLLEFARDPDTGQLTRIPGRAGCLGAARVPSCTLLARKFLPDDAAEVARGRAVVLASSSTTRATGTLTVLQRRATSTGALVPGRGARTCVSSAPTRSCQRVRGWGLTYATLTASRDGRYLYATGDAIDAFRVTR
jgi:hypothetical protein